MEGDDLAGRALRRSSAAPSRREHVHPPATLKVAMVHLGARLIAGGFSLLDTQFVTQHLRSFGAVEVPRGATARCLDQAVTGNGDFSRLPSIQRRRGAADHRKSVRVVINGRFEMRKH